MPTGGRTPPSANGVFDGAIAGDSAGDVERVVPEGTETGSVIVQATKSGGNSGIVAIGFSEDVDQTSGILLKDGDIFTVDLDVSSQGLYVHFDTAGDQIRVMATD